jgi:hypothetical protein
VPDLELAPELWSAGLSRKEFEQEREPEFELTLDSEREFGLTPAESELEREPELGLELELQEREA